MSETMRVRQSRWNRSPRAGIAARAAGGVCGIAGGLMLLMVAAIPLQPQQQAVLAVANLAVFLVANRVKGRAISVFLVVLSLATSLRYIFWRLTQTLDFANFSDLALGSGLALAEIYAIVVLVLGYIQTLWPLERKPLALPEDLARWPTVDVYIPTYNEAMSIVRATVLGAIGMDWPPGKMRVWLLDDGRREEFRAFAAECGIGYLARTENAHAKAGNLNHALKHTEGEFIAVFDCDHIPTRAFLQMTLGWLVAEPAMALVQTPHHFYSPDPFQRNLAAGARVPSEGNMFYGLVQDANDYWNAAFFCGSCAVLRRTALADIGGFAVETVTEDAHTMLKMHRRGWESAYLKLPLAAGLATERLILHIGQRVRWARGMIQILRIDNPLLGPGLSLGQRICYFQAMLHFLFALPRVVFLTSPLAYLLFDINVIAASPLAIVAYALPHIFHAVATNSRLLRNNRHSFWSEIYETVLALFLVRMTIVTLLAPHRGKFNVTRKGDVLESGYLDLAAVYPNLILALALVGGVGRGLVSMVFFNPGQIVFQALLLNTIWAVISLLVVTAALAVGRETRQLRAHTSIRAAVPVAVYLPDGRAILGVTQDLSQSGSAVLADRPVGVSAGSPVQFEFIIGGAPVVIPARLLDWEQGQLRASFQPENLADEAAIVHVVFGRADAWIDWAAYPVDRPLTSLWRVLVSIGGLFRPADRAPEARPPAAVRPHLAGTAAAIALALCWPGAIKAQQHPAHASSGFVIRPIPGRIDAPSAGMPFETSAITQQTPSTPAPGLLGVIPHSPDDAMGRLGSLSAPFPEPAPAPQTADLSPVPLPAGFGMTEPGAPALPSLGPGPASSPDPGLAALPSRKLVLTLRQLGVLGPLTLRGTSELQGVQFGIRADEVVTAAALDLAGATSPALLPEFSNVTVTLNEQYVGTIPVIRGQPSFQHLEMPISPVFFQDDNRLNFRFSGRYTQDCNDPLSGLLWTTISDTATMTLTLARLPAQRDLARLPLPFFDEHERTKLQLPIVLPPNPSNETLQAAGIIASWFGQLADFRGVSFPILTEAPVDGNAIAVLSGNEQADGVAMSPLAGPTISVIANPHDGAASLLVVAGRTGAEAVDAATALALGSRALSGSSTAVTPVDAPRRAPYDAPAWIPSDRPVRLGELVDASDLQGSGYVPGAMRVTFRTAPDLFTWRDGPFPLELRYRAPPGPIEDLAVSRLDVSINDAYLASLPLAVEAPHAMSWFSRLMNAGLDRSWSRVDIPPYRVFGQNALQFSFDTRPLHRGTCVAVPQDLRMGVDPDSTLDMSRAYHFAQLPNLAYFVSAGFPFTRMADLSETAVVLPLQPNAGELGAYLTLMGRIGALTGYPVLRLAVVRPDDLHAVADRNLLVIGALARLGAAADLLQGAPYHARGGKLEVSLSGRPLEGLRRVFGDVEPPDRAAAAAALMAPAAADGAALVGGQSPLQSGRSVVALLGGSSAAMSALMTALYDPDQAPLVRGDLALLTGGRFTSYRVGPEFTSGALPFWLYLPWLLRDQPLTVVAIMIAGSALLGACYFAALRRRATVRARLLPARRTPSAGA